MQPNITYKNITTASGPLFDGAMDIYLEAFPSNERQSLETIISRLESGKSQLIVGVHQDKVVSMALLWDFKNSPFILLDYMAIRLDIRGMQLGSRMFKYLLTMVEQEERFLIMEVEDPNFGENKEQRKRRVDFYLKNGAYIMKDVPYVLPSLDGTSPTEMLLMIAPGTHEKKIKTDYAKDLITRLYVEVYEKKIDDSVLKNIIENIPETVYLKSDS